MILCSLISNNVCAWQLGYLMLLLLLTNYRVYNVMFWFMHTIQNYSKLTSTYPLCCLLVIVYNDRPPLSTWNFTPFDLQKINNCTCERMYSLQNEASTSTSNGNIFLFALVQTLKKHYYWLLSPLQATEVTDCWPVSMFRSGSPSLLCMPVACREGQDQMIWTIKGSATDMTAW